MDGSMRGDFDEDDLDDDDGDPECSSCGADLYTEDHDLDCPFAGDDDDDDFAEDTAQYDYED